MSYPAEHVRTLTAEQEERCYQVARCRGIDGPRVNARQPDRPTKADQELDGVRAAMALAVHAGRADFTPNCDTFLTIPAVEIPGHGGWGVAAVGEDRLDLIVRPGERMDPKVSVLVTATTIVLRGWFDPLDVPAAGYSPQARGASTDQAFWIPSRDLRPNFPWCSHCTARAVAGTCLKCTMVPLAAMRPHLLAFDEVTALLCPAHFREFAAAKQAREARRLRDANRIFCACGNEKYLDRPGPCERCRMGLGPPNPEVPQGVRRDVPHAPQTERRDVPRGAHLMRLADGTLELWTSNRS